MKIITIEMWAELKKKAKKASRGIPKERNWRKKEKVYYNALSDAYDSLERDLPDYPFHDTDLRPGDVILFRYTAYLGPDGKSYRVREIYKDKVVSNTNGITTKGGYRPQSCDVFAIVRRN